jgi:Transcriptional regulator, AbiEi antitoxin
VKCTRSRSTGPLRTYPQVSSAPLDFGGGPETLEVRSRQAIPAQLSELAALQAGVVSREQVIGCGLSRAVVERLVASGWWSILARGIYQTSPGPPSWNGLAWAGLLLGGDQARLGPRASGYLHDLVDDAPIPLDVLVPQDRFCRVTGPWVFARERPGARTRRALGAPARLSVEDTVLDLVGAGSQRELVGVLTRGPATPNLDLGPAGCAGAAQPAPPPAAPAGSARRRLPGCGVPSGAPVPARRRATPRSADGVSATPSSRLAIRQRRGLRRLRVAGRAGRSRRTRG